MLTGELGKETCPYVYDKKKQHASCMLCGLYKINRIKPVSQKDQKLVSKTNYLLMQVKSIAERFSMLFFVLSILEWPFLFVCLILYVPSTIFQLNRDGPSWVEPVLS